MVHVHLLQEPSKLVFAVGPVFGYCFERRSDAPLLVREPLLRVSELVRSDLVVGPQDDKSRQLLIFLVELLSEFSLLSSSLLRLHAPTLAFLLGLPGHDWLWNPDLFPGAIEGSKDLVVSYCTLPAREAGSPMRAPVVMVGSDDDVCGITFWADLAVEGRKLVFARAAAPTMLLFRRCATAALSAPVNVFETELWIA